MLDKDLEHGFIGAKTESTCKSFLERSFLAATMDEDKENKLRKARENIENEKRMKDGGALFGDMRRALFKYRKEPSSAGTSSSSVDEDDMLDLVQVSERSQYNRVFVFPLLFVCLD